jgi:hypothetical protein
MSAQGKPLRLGIWNSACLFSTTRVALARARKKEKQTSHARVHYIWVIGNSATRTSGGKKDRETKEIISQRVKIWLALFLTASF